MRRSAAALLVLLAAAPAAPAASAGDWSLGYSGLRESGDIVPGAVLARRWRADSALRLALEATAHSGTPAGESLRALGLMAGAELAPWRRARLSPFLSVKAGAVGTSRHVEILGVSISPTGVCGGTCGYEIGPAGEAGAGLDLGLHGRWTLRVAEIDYRASRVAGATERGWRVSAAIVRR